MGRSVPTLLRSALPPGWFAFGLLLWAVMLAQPCSSNAAEPAPVREPVPIGEVAIVPVANEPTYPIDLPSAVALAERKNPTIALARESVFTNLALEQQAKALLYPTLVAGGNLHIHRGVLQRDTGEILPVNSDSLYLGGGAGAIGAGSVAIPAVRVFAPLSNALFEPLVAEQRVAVSRFDSRAASNSILLETIVAYLDLVAAEASRDAFARADSDAAHVVATVDAFVKVGQARKADSDRAHTRALLLRNQFLHSEERVGVAASKLSRLLSLNPSIRLHAPEGQVQPIEVVDASYDLPALIGIALHCRPEMAARNAAIGMSEAQWQEERWRPLLPTVSAGYSAGEFGGGSNLSSPPAFSSSGRSDFDVAAVWTLQNAGLGNLAMQHRREAEIDQATSERAKTACAIQEQVADSYAQAVAGRQQIEIAAQQLATADSGFHEELNRIRNGEGLPIEVLNSLDLLARARQDVINATIEYDEAEFGLFVAIGNPSTTAFCARSSAR